MNEVCQLHHFCLISKKTNLQFIPINSNQPRVSQISPVFPNPSHLFIPPSPFSVRGRHLAALRRLAPQRRVHVAVALAAAVDRAAEGHHAEVAQRLTKLGNAWLRNGEKNPWNTAIVGPPNDTLW